MKRPGRTALILATLGAILVLFASPVVAQEDAGTTDAVVTESGIEPAVEVPEDGAAEAIPDWTYRYMVPLTLALAAVIVLATSIRYFTNVVRKRYRTVEG